MNILWITRASFVALSLLTASASGADGRQTTGSTAHVQYSAIVETEIAYGLNRNQGQKAELLFMPEFNVDLNNNYRLTAIGRFRFDARDLLEPGRPVQDTTSSFTRRYPVGEKAELELREIYVEGRMGKSFLIAGKQQIVWGKADGLKVLDVVNPQNFREFILDDFEDSRIPLWALNVEVPIGKNTLQLIWIPDKSYHQLPQQGALFAITSPAIVPAPQPGVNVVQQSVVRPDGFFNTSDYGLRFSTFHKGWDLTFNYLYHYRDAPVLFQSLFLTPQGPVVTVTPRYQRSHLLGGSFSKAFGKFVVRGEMGFSSHRFFLTNDPMDTDGVVKTREFAYVFGLDWSGIRNTLISGQIFQSRLKDDLPGLVRDKVDTTVTFLARRHFKNETLTAEILWLYNLNNNDGLVRPKVSYEWKDNVKIWVGVDVFYGNNKGLFGQFDQNDRLVVGMEWGF